MFILTYVFPIYIHDEPDGSFILRKAIGSDLLKVSKFFSFRQEINISRDYLTATTLGIPGGGRDYIL